MPDDDENTNPGWTPDIARMLLGELRKATETNRELVLVLREVRDELVMLREDRRKRGDRRTVPRAG